MHPTKMKAFVDVFNYMQKYKFNKDINKLYLCIINNYDINCNKC